MRLWHKERRSEMLLWFQGGMEEGERAQILLYKTLCTLGMDWPDFSTILWRNPINAGPKHDMQSGEVCRCRGKKCQKEHFESTNMTWTMSCLLVNIVVKTQFPFFQFWILFAPVSYFFAFQCTIEQLRE